MIKSTELVSRAIKVMPGGVNSPVRAWNSVGGDPIFAQKGVGSRIISSEGREFVDFCGSWGPLILGHAHPQVISAVSKIAASGLTFGVTTELEILMAETVCEIIPYLEMVRFVNSGTEATMTAIRLARGYTKRQKILKFDGCYHGHSDFLLISAGSGLLTGGIATSLGVPANIAEDVLVAPYNNLEAVQSVISTYGQELAAVIIEPVAGNMGLVRPEPGFLEGLRKMTHDCGALLIFDEVITAFRVGPSTYGEIVGVTPDLTCLGKIIGGGMPIGAVGGPSSIMEFLAPNGDVYQAGTLSGNPVAITAGLTTLKILQENDPYPEIEKKLKVLKNEIKKHKGHDRVPCSFSSLGGMFTLFFAESVVKDLASAKKSNTSLYAEFFHFMLSRGFYLPPSQFEVCFISAAHSTEEIVNFTEAVNDFFNLKLHEA